VTLVSVCVPCHNAGPWLAATLEALLAQTWRELEIIVVDDGSDDGSGALLDGYRERGVTVVHQAAGGAARARNTALARVRGTVVKFFDADDLLSPDLIERQLIALGGREDGVASCGWGRFRRADGSDLQRNPEPVWCTLPADDWLVQAWRWARPMMQPGLFLIPRTLLDRCGGWDERLSLIDDFEFYSRVLCAAREVRFTPEAVVAYRSALPGSLSSRKDRRAMESAQLSLRLGTGHLLARRTDAAARRSCANMLQNFVHEAWADPGCRDLAAALEPEIERLGGSDLPLPGGPRLQRLGRLIGWRRAVRLQASLRRLRPSP
jgi:glycosyltransferase involved in cell wall biosynthesis